MAELVARAKMLIRRPATVHESMTIVAKPKPCELCSPVQVVSENELAYVRYDNNSSVPNPSIWTSPFAQCEVD